MMDARAAGENELDRIQIQTQTQKQIQKFVNLENVKNSLRYILLMHFLVSAVATTVTLSCKLRTAKLERELNNNGLPK
jgi:hypothetical protein